MNKELLVFITAASPVIELRGAIPLGIALGLPASEVFLLSLLGNIMPVPFILISTRSLIGWLKNIAFIEGWLSNWSTRKTRKLFSKIQRWGWLGLLIFVAVPLPGTGAWTGSVAAALLGLNFWLSFVTVFLGIITAGLLITAAGLTINLSL
ncbi:MAG: small multi-drug export protein [Syntrophomonadaceae bacterium]|nr:small multi-drug export protein [Syntrophomonadaceae bacterium]